MSDFLNLLKERRSVRNYEEKAIPEDVVNELLEAVQWSPSWANTQCWEVVVVEDPAIKAELAETLAKGNPAKKNFVAAPVVFVLGAKLKSSGYYKEQVTTKFGDWFLFDMGICTQSLCLAAQAHGLGTVIVGLFDQDAAKKVVGLPDGYEVVTMIPTGYPSKVPSAPNRREIAGFVHKNRFSGAL
ncbi:MAG: nitroreductase family protein [Desulfatibacillaceae bacterium]|nr:nitroreductase family protein [Desulfatibacillaceae bacterium]